MEKDSSTKKSLCVWGESQSYVGMKQAEKTTLLQTWTISYEMGRLTQGMGPGAHPERRQSQEPQRTIFKEHNCAFLFVCFI